MQAIEIEKVLEIAEHVGETILGAESVLNLKSSDVGLKIQPVIDGRGPFKPEALRFLEGLKKALDKEFGEEQMKATLKSGDPKRPLEVIYTVLVYENGI
jgi:hypothetical protein